MVGALAVLALAKAAVVLTSATIAFEAPGVSPAEALVHRVEMHHRGIADLTAQFVQTYRSGALGRDVVERGTVAIKRPGRMLWEYRDPERKTFVSDGNTFFFYVPADHQVIVRNQKGERSLAVWLLSGQGDILSEFEVGLQTAPSGRPRLRLTPRKADPEVEHVYVEVDEAYRIVGIEVLDLQGNRSQFRFEAIRENGGLPDKLFRFNIPRGVEVITG